MQFQRFVRTATAVAAVAWLSGCATTVQLNYRTQPDGAQLYADGRYLGTGAGSVGARLSKDRWRAGQHCVVLPPVEAHWVSGAQVQAPPRRICLQSFTGGVVYRDALIVRPADAPGLRADLDYADQLAQQRLAERQVRAVEAAAAAEAEAARERALEIRLRRHQEREHRELAQRDRDRDEYDRDRHDRDRQDRDRQDRDRQDRDRQDRDRQDRDRQDRPDSAKRAPARADQGRPRHPGTDGRQDERSGKPAPSDKAGAKERKRERLPAYKQMQLEKLEREGSGR